MIETAATQGMRWLIHYSSFGDYLYVAVFAPSKERAERIAEDFLRQARTLSTDMKARLGGWHREVWAVDHQSAETLWERARKQPEFFIYRQEAW